VGASCRASLLLIAGSSDHVVPASIDKATSECFQRKSSALTDHKKYPDRSHFTVGQKGWEEVAD
jgi:alpha-beta hydrolase superfamily lysophospholipase